MSVRPLPPPFINPPGRVWLEFKQPPPGSWVEWDCAGERGWTLKCLPDFIAEIRFEHHNRTYWLRINGVRFGTGTDLEPMQVRAEYEIVQRGPKETPAWRGIHARLAGRQEGPIAVTLAPCVGCGAPYTWVETALDGSTIPYCEPCRILAGLTV